MKTLINRQILTRKFYAIFAVAALFFISSQSFASPIISGISSNEIEIDTKFRGTKVLLFGARGDAGNIVIAVRGPKKNFTVTKKEKLLGIWYNGERVKFKNTTSFYSLFSTFGEDNDNSEIDEILSDLELGKNNLKFENFDEVDEAKKSEFKLQLIDHLEHKNLYSNSTHRIEFLDETLFKVILDFPKNTPRGVYSVEIYLINEGELVSFQSIPIYVNQVGMSARIFDFANEESFLYGLIAVSVALVVGWLANYIFLRFIGK